MSWIDILFPPTCVSCEAAGDWLCEDCLRQVVLYAHPREMKTGFRSLISCGAYADPVLRKMVTTFKYRSAKCLQSAWTRLLQRFRASFLDAWPWAGEEEMIVTSVPADPRRSRARGMDHAALIAQAVTDVLVPWASRERLLERVRMTPQNALLPADATRSINISGAFCATRSINSPVLLVDDVMTTGSTLEEAANILLAAGAPRVYGVVMAEG